MDSNGEIISTVDDDSAYTCSKTKLWRCGSPWSQDLIDDLEAACKKDFPEELELFWVNMGPAYLFTFGVFVVLLVLKQLIPEEVTEALANKAADDTSVSGAYASGFDLSIEGTDQIFSFCLAICLFLDIISYYMTLYHYEIMGQGNRKCDFYCQLALPLSRAIFYGITGYMSYVIRVIVKIPDLMQAKRTYIGKVYNCQNENTTFIV